jgi:hypothetical protein
MFCNRAGVVQCNPVCDYETRIDFASRNAVYQETLQPHPAKGSIPGRLPSRLARHLVPVLFRTRCADSGFHILSPPGEAGQPAFLRTLSIIPEPIRWCGEDVRPFLFHFINGLLNDLGFRTFHLLRYQCQEFPILMVFRLCFNDTRTPLSSVSNASYKSRFSCSFFTHYLLRTFRAGDSYGDRFSDIFTPY